MRRCFVDWIAGRFRDALDACGPLKGPDEVPGPQAGAQRILTDEPFRAHQRGGGPPGSGALPAQL